MISDRWARVQEIFRRVLERGPADRGSLLQEMCGGDVELVQTVGSLLAAHDAGGVVGEMDDDALQLGQRELEQLTAALEDRYSVQHALGAGGMATVYRALDRRHDRDVAIKVLRSEVSRGLGADRFLREIKIAAGLRHPHILPLYDSGEAADLLYYVMPVEGESLRDLLLRDTVLGLDTALRITREVTGALDYAHAQGIVHRDIKPENILLSHGHAVISDFGIARAIQAAGGGRGAKITQAGLPIGSPAYMSPEQIDADVEVDGRSDLYSLALTLYEMLTGRLAFVGPNAQALLARRARTPAPELTLPPTVPAHVASAVQRTLAVRRDERPTTGAEFMRLLDGTQAARIPVTVTTPGTSVRGRSIAVLPFENLSGDPEDDYLSDGLTEEVINSLAQLRDLRVAARTSSFALKGATLDIPAVGAKLNVETILEGSVRRAGSRLRITSQLVNVSDGYHIWSERYDRDVGDVFAIQDEIANTIVDRLKISLAAGEQALAKPPTTDVEAYHLYLKGRHLWNKRSKESLEQALRFYEEAITRDPAFALAHSGIADTCLLLGSYNYAPRQETIARARAAVDTALGLDDSLAEAYTSRGQILRLERDWLGEEAAYRRAIELNPNYATAHQWYATHLSARLRHEEALREIRIAEELDPLSHAISVTVAVVLVDARQYEAALEQLEKTVALEPNFASAHAWLGIVHAQLGMHDAVIEDIGRATALAPDNPNVLSALAYSHAINGNREEALRVLEGARARGAGAWGAVVHTALGDHDKAFEMMFEAVDGYDTFEMLFYIKAFPWLDPLHDDPRFNELVRRLKFPEEA